MAWRARMLEAQIQALGWRTNAHLKIRYALRTGRSHLAVNLFENSVGWSWHNFGDKSGRSDTQILQIIGIIFFILFILYFFNFIFILFYFFFFFLKPFIYFGVFLSITPGKIMELSFLDVLLLFKAVNKLITDKTQNIFNLIAERYGFIRYLKLDYSN